MIQLILWIIKVILIYTRKTEEIGITTESNYITIDGIILLNALLIILHPYSKNREVQNDKIFFIYFQTQMALAAMSIGTSFP